MRKLALFYISANLSNVCFPHWILLSAPTLIHYYIALAKIYKEKSALHGFTVGKRKIVLIILPGGWRYSSGPRLLSIAVIKYSDQKQLGEGFIVTHSFK